MPDVEELFAAIESNEPGSREAATALATLQGIAESGDLDVAEGIAEVFAFSPANRDPAKAYFWYHVALARQGYAAKFNNLHDRLDQYCGPDGDFRNEPQVNELLSELGESRIRQLDAQAAAWLKMQRGG